MKENKMKNTCTERYDPVSCGKNQNGPYDGADTSFEDLSGPRIIVLCAKVSEKLADAVHSLIKRSERYETANDFVEKAIHDLYIRELEIERESNVE